MPKEILLTSKDKLHRLIQLTRKNHTYPFQTSNTRQLQHLKLYDSILFPTD